MMGMGWGDSFAVAQQMEDDFIFEGDIQLTEGNATGLLFRANTDATDGYVANVDANDDVVKLWRVGVGQLVIYPTPLEPMGTHRLRVQAEGNRIRVWLDDTPAIDHIVDGPLEGHFGLNVFNGIALFNNLAFSPFPMSSGIMVYGSWR